VEEMEIRDFGIPKVKKVLLLYSGGLDTSCILKLIQEKCEADIVTLTMDIGQPDVNLNKVKQKALKLGAKKAYVIDVKKVFADNYVSKAIRANALYQGKYPLSTALGRPLLAKLAIETAKKEKIDMIVHGCSGKGNDQVRIECCAKCLDPEIKFIAPVRDWNLTRDEEIDYVIKHGISTPVTKKSPYSVDENLWGKSSECGILEHPDKEPPKGIFNFVTIPEKAPNKPEYITLEFEKGIPIALNGKGMELWRLITELNKIAGKHGVGIIDHMEDRVVGLKSREIYECPGAMCIIEAHKDLEKFVSTLHENSFKGMIDQKWSEMVYYGLWFDPLMKSLNAFIEKINEKVTGVVKLKLYKGNVIVVGRESEYALYDLKLATYDKGQIFDQKASCGFIELWSLQSRIANQVGK
jgi:argininosuccinate synthase